LAELRVSLENEPVTIQGARGPSDPHGGPPFAPDYSEQMF
jgi:hypothetical protein